MFAKPTGIPRQSGCYLFKNSADTVIYVGKALSLNQRLSSYFQKYGALSAKTQALMDEAVSVEWIVTPSEIDALILENELIKQNQPRYNMRLKDDKSFPYVAIDSRTAFPVPYITRARHQRGVRYFGPFVDVRALRHTMDELLQTFPLRSCSTHKWDYHQRIGRPCLLYDINKCSGPCVGAIDISGYGELVASWARFFDGDVRELRSLLHEQMAVAAQQQHYEAAAKARDGLAALERAASDQSIVLDDHSNLDAVAIATQGGRAALVRFRVRQGRIIGRTVHHIDRSMDESDVEIFEAALPELYDDRALIPPVVLTSADVATSLIAVQFLAEGRERSVEIVAPQRGRRRRVFDLALKDAQAVIDRDSLRRQNDHNVRSRALQELGSALGLQQPPYRIECFDMSHLQGTHYVGSMVVFEDGLAKKVDYRHFNVKEILGNDDVGAMQEVVGRRLGYWNEDQSLSKFRRANLIIIDGGLPQLHAAEKAAAALGLAQQVEFVALAKREELLYRPGSSVPIALDRGSESLYLVQRIRDEAHRFAISFHRSKRAKSMVATLLDGIEGLGPKRRERLMLEMGSLEHLRGATMEELSALVWLPTSVAQNIYDHLRAPSAPGLSKGSRNDD
ncbi:MAG: excinuclease ABC subunit UvrC [Acidimicrobiaceae bacterium]|nr:excinuclease ABC subunit UvrC [Acidimicrobiaceae bacterium]